MGLIFDSVNDRISSTSGPVSFPGRLDTPASVSGGAGLRVPHGTAPSAPTNGDVWTTTAGMYARISGGTVGPFGAGGTPAGSDTQVQFNNSGAFGGDQELAWNNTTKTLKIGTVSPSNGVGRLQVTAADPTAWASNWTVALGHSAVIATTGSAATLSLTGNPYSTGLQLFWQAGGTSSLKNLTNFDFALGSFSAINLTFKTGALTEFAGKIVGSASTTARSTLNVPHGVAPSAPADGDVWTTTAGMYSRINGGTVGPFGAGGTPGGSDTQVQFNDGGALGGDADFTWNKTTNLLTLGGEITQSLSTATAITNTFNNSSTDRFRNALAADGSAFTLQRYSNGSVWIDLFKFYRSTGSVEFQGGSMSFLDSGGGALGGLAINGGNFQIQALNAGTNLVFLTDSGTRRATIFNSTGNVNVGATTTDPSAKLRVEGLLLTDASDASEAGLRLPHGTAPSAPTNGDVWTTTAGIYVRINGVTVGPLSTGGGTGESFHPFLLMGA